MNLRPVLALVLVVALSACKQQTATPAGSAAEVKEAGKDYYNYKFKGTLPCADCPGIVTELSFYDDSLNYREKATNLERNSTFEKQGSYIIVKGYKENENQLVFILDEQDGHGRPFLQVDDSTLLMLDGNREIISWAQSFQLHQVKK